MTEPTVRDPVVTLTAPARQLTVGDDFARMDTALIDATVAALAQRGWRVKEAANLREMEHRFAGTDASRAAGLNAALSDPDTDLILALRGGYGTARLLPLIDWEAARRSYAVFVGLSDLTAFNLALFAKTGRSSWQGPVARMFTEANDLRDERFEQALTSPNFRLETPISGDAVETEGTLWGGNLTVLVSLLGTPYFPSVEGGILFIEDVGEPAWRVERLLLQLLQAGVLTKQKAVLAGSFTGADKTAGTGDGRFSLTDAFGWIRQAAGIPIVEGLAFGHRPDTLTLPVGVSASVKAEEGRLTLNAQNCPVPASVPWRETPPADLWWH